MAWCRRSILRTAGVVLTTLAGCGARAPTARTRSRGDRRIRPTLPSTTPTAGITSAAPSLSVSWETGPEMVARRTQTTAVGLDGRLYVIGGIVDQERERTTAVYDTTSNRWETAAPPPRPVNHTSAVAIDGRIHVFGGYSGSFLGSSPLSVHWIFEPASDSWHAGPPLPTPRGALVAVLAGDRVLSIGGAVDEGTTDLVEIYDPAAESWTTGSPMPTPREHLAATTIDGAVFVAGGRQGLGPMISVTERYDPSRDVWSTRTPMPTARAGIAGDALAGRLYVFGGEEVGRQVFEAVSAYHPSRNDWTAVTPLPTPRWGLGVATIGDRIYTVGGGAIPSGQATRTLEIMSVA